MSQWSPASALVGPDWSVPLAHVLGVPRLPSFSAALQESVPSRLVVVDQAPRGIAVANRRDAVAALARQHEEMLVVSYASDHHDYLRPFAEDGPVPANLSFCGPDVTVGELADWLAVPVLQNVRGEVALGDDYLRDDVPVTRADPIDGYKRMYAALDPGGQLAVCGAFSGVFVPLDCDWLCGHDPQHSHVGPDCYDGFAAYLHREDALLFRAPDACVALVEFSGTVVAADSSVTRPGMRAEHQRVRRLEFPAACACGAAAVTLVLADRAVGRYTDLAPVCVDCAKGRPSRSLQDLARTAGDVTLSWLDPKAD